MLADVFGFDKYAEITSEYAIRGTYCDLATKLEGVLVKLIEVKAIGLDLKEQHVKQAVDYAANQGVDWVVLTNGLIWRVFKVTFTKPINAEVVVDIDFASINPKSQKDLETLYLFCKEGWSKSVLGEYHSQKQALSRYYIGNILLADPVVQVVRRELRRLFPDVRIESEEIEQVLTSEVLKREVLEARKPTKRKRKSAGCKTSWSKKRRRRRLSMQTTVRPLMLMWLKNRAEMLKPGDRRLLPICWWSMPSATAVSRCRCVVAVWASDVASAALGSAG